MPPSEQAENRDDLTEQINVDLEKIQTLGGEAKDYQEDKENLLEKLKTLRGGKGVYASSDAKTQETIQEAIRIRETNLQEAQAKIGEVKAEMETKLENLNKAIAAQGERLEQMESLADSLNNKDEVVVIIRDETTLQKKDKEDAEEKSDVLGKIIEKAAQFLLGFGAAAAGMAQLLAELQNMGIRR